MPGHHTLTHLTHEVTGTALAERAAGKPDSRITTGRVARELGLRRSEFDLAVDLGRIRTAFGDGGDGGDGRDAGGGGEGRRVARAEIERLRAGPDSPGTLSRSVRTVGAAEGAALLEVPSTRFIRLARLGLLVPVRLRLRLRAVVWLHLALEYGCSGPTTRTRRC
ncbi:hypothetical protein HTV45_24745 [Streptomyces sp. CHD11]|nr:hypothetical protein [Streptomyces sp. CHD11]